MKRCLKSGLLALALVLSAGCCTVKGSRALDYRVDTMWVKTSKPMGEFQEYLNAQSKEGWQLVGFEEHDNNFRVVLSRPK
jgi:hypothetical protein